MSGNTVFVELNGKETQLLDAIRRVNNEFGNTEEKIKGTRRQTVSMETAMRNALVSVNLLAKAQQFVVDNLREEVALRQRAADLLKEGAGGLAQLGQLARDRQELKEMMGQARELVETGAARDIDAAARQVFAIESAGFRESAGILRQIAASGLFSDIVSLSESVNQLQSAFGKGETGSLADVISKILGAAATSPGTPEQLLAQATRSAGPAGPAGLALRDEEVMAGINVIARASGIERSGTLLNSFLMSIAESGEFRGKTLQEIVQDVKTRNLTFEQLKEFFGRSEAVEGFNALAQNVTDLADVVKEIEVAQRDNLLTQRLRLVETDDLLSAAAARRRAEGGREAMLGFDIGQPAALAEAAEAEFERNIAQQPFFIRHIARAQLKATQGLRAVLGDEDFMQRALTANQLGTAGDSFQLSPQLMLRMVDSLERLENINRDQAESFRRFINKQDMENKLTPRAIPVPEQ